MKKCMICLLATMLLLSSAHALEVSSDDLDYWYEQMRILVEDVGSRKAGTAGEKLAHAYLESHFRELGFSPEDGTLKQSVCINPWSETESYSLIAIKPALNPDAQILTVCAHYDSHGPGARDNASGTAAMLTMCRLFSGMAPYADTELRFIAFSAEESGHQGSLGYCAELTADELARSLATFNIDILVMGVEEENRALSMDTMGMRTADSYVNGSANSPAFNRAAKALLSAMDETGYFTPEDEEVLWCGPRHLGDSDHESFHLSGVDAVNYCFRGTTASGGRWPDLMHRSGDAMGDFDINRTWEALDILYTALDGLANDPSYGD